MYRMARCCLALSLLALALVAPTASADPGGSNFTFTPNPPDQGEAVTFTFEPGPDINGTPQVEWDLDGDGVYETPGTPDAERTYSQHGPVTVRMRVTDDDPGAEATAQKTVTVNALPVVSFDFNPTSPLPDQEVLFAPVVSDPDGDDVTLEWDFGDGGSATSQAPRHAYATPGTRTVTLTATDEHGGTRVDMRQITVRDPSGPTANFTVSPSAPLVGQNITFTNASTPASGVSLAWDLDDDGEFDDSTSSVATRAFATPGIHEVSLRVTQTSNGNAAVREINVLVNAPPFAAFLWSPAAVVAGNEVDLISTSTDVEGSVATAWDLDGDGGYDDAAGARVSHIFPTAGTYNVGLRATDSKAVARTTRREIAVRAQPRPPAPPVDDESPDFMAPFPVVRLGGKVLPRAARVQILTVRAPRGALIRVRCVGDACPVKVARRRSRGRAIRFRMFEETLDAGTRLGIYVRQPETVGKYTRFTIRAGAAPKRLDRCLMPGRARPVRCP